jgi:hypothetical protein
MDLKKIKEQYAAAVKLGDTGNFVVMTKPHLIDELIRLAERQEKELTEARTQLTPVVSLTDDQCWGMKELSSMAADAWAEAHVTERSKEQVAGFFVRDLMHRVGLATLGVQATVNELAEHAADMICSDIGHQVGESGRSRTTQTIIYALVRYALIIRGEKACEAKQALPMAVCMASPAQGDAGQWIERRESAAQSSNGADKENAAAILALAEELIGHCEQCEMVVRIETEPLKPLAMGNYKMVASVQPRRVPGVPYDQLNKPRKSDGILARAMRDVAIASAASAPSDQGPMSQNGGV